MEFKNHGNGILELADDSLINTAEGLLNIFAEYECEALIVKISHLCPAFFRLSTGVAGDMLQKISTYRLKFAVYGDFSEAPKPFPDFIRESNRHKQVIFTDTAEQAVEIFNSVKSNEI